MQTHSQKYYFEEATLRTALPLAIPKYIRIHIVFTYFRFHSLISINVTPNRLSVPAVRRVPVMVAS